jgi:hypothetical protein
MSSSLIQEFTEFVQGPYLDYNCYAAAGDYTWEEVDALNRFNSFFARGLNADQRDSDGESVLMLYVKSILKGSRYALDDGGDEVKQIISQMLANGGRAVLRETEDFLIEPLCDIENDPDSYLEETFSGDGHYVRAFLFKVFKTDMKRYVPNWEKIKQIKVEDGQATKKDCLRAIKGLMRN